MIGCTEPAQKACDFSRTGGHLGTKPGCQSYCPPSPTPCRRNHFILNVPLLTNVTGLTKCLSNLSVSTEMGMEGMASCKTHPRLCQESPDFRPNPGLKSLTSLNSDFLGEAAVIAMRC